MKILAIDTSCDETAVAVCENDRLLSNVISSQVRFHKEFGGVVPSLAKRKHQELIDGIIEIALKRAGITIENIDAFAVTKGPGLAPALEVGIAKAKELSLKHSKPLIPVNHMEGHIYSCLAKNSQGNPDFNYSFPVFVVLISGGHTELVLMKNHGEYEIVGKTLDDAIGECFDKVGRMLDLGYPAGPVLEKIAENGDENFFELPIAMKQSKDANMSYSGLKTAAMQLIGVEKSKIESWNSQTIANIAASFQKAAVDQLLLKINYGLTELKTQNLEFKTILVGGGVSQNKYLRKKLKTKFGKEFSIHYPSDKKLYTDNAGMIAVAAYFNALSGKILKEEQDIESVDREPNWSLA